MLLRSYKKNNPVQEKSWKFTVGDGKSYGAFVNNELTRGENYIVYQRALTDYNSASKILICIYSSADLAYHTTLIQ